MPSLLYLLSTINMVILMQSNGHAMARSNLYGDDIHVPELRSVFGAGMGILNFLNEDQFNLEMEVPDKIPKSTAVYDFIVVGAGTAGATVAARLSETPDVTVLLIEAGSNENLIMDIPLFPHLLQLSDDINWKYRTKPSEKYCLGMEGNSCNWARGKVMGGSSVLNYMIATRGGAEDYDRWAEMGNDGWAYKDVLKYFRKLETIDIPGLQSDTIYHGNKGPVHISEVFHTPLAKAFLEAGKELGYPIVDYNGKNMIGFSYLQTTIMNGIRMSSNRAYLHPARGRKNLHVTRQSLVKRVLIDRRRNQTVGVEFVKHGRAISVSAAKEVIMCAGAIGSPQLLMLSGIGPVKHLAELGINVVKDAPVGENLMDHIAYGGLTYEVEAPVSLRFLDLIDPTQPYMMDFLMKRSGPWTIPGACEALAYINTEDPGKRNGLPDVELIFMGGAFKEDMILQMTVGLSARMRQIWNTYSGIFGWTIMPMVLRPKSRGRISLLANDINVKPEIVPNYFGDPEDIKTMIAGIKAAISVGQTEAMWKFGSRLTNDTFPGCENYEYNSDAYWECMMRTLTYSIYHYSGTCKMAPRGDPTAVVDPKLKVIGVHGLRVADASIMPEIVSGHINIPVYMIAEKVADMIKEEWGLREKSRP